MTDTISLTAVPASALGTAPAPAPAQPTSLYESHRDIPAFHQATYPKRRPDRFGDLRRVQSAATSTVACTLDLSYQQFIDGDFAVVEVGVSA